MTVAVSKPAAASRFLLLYNSQIVGFSIAVIFFALIRQAHSWDLDLPIPSLLTAVESNLSPLPFFILGVIPIFVSLSISLLMSQPLPSFVSFIIVVLICYLFANGSTILLVSFSQFVFYAAATIHVFIKKRWHRGEGDFSFGFLHWFINLSSSFISLKVVRVVRLNPLLVTAITAITLGCLVHPAFGLFILLLSHAFCCHNALCSFLTASFRSHARRNELFDYKDEGNERTQEYIFKHKGDINHNSPVEAKSSDSANLNSFGDTQLEIFNHRHGLFILHLLAALMFLPSLVAWLQRIGLGHTFPWFLDSALCIGVILHGVLNAKPECNSTFSIPAILGRELRLAFLYVLAGYYSYLSGLGLEPYKVFYAMAALGFICFILRVLQRNKENGEPRFARKKRSHKH